MLSGVGTVMVEFVGDEDRCLLLWDLFEKNQFNRVTFAGFFRRFVEASCIQESLLHGSDQSLVKRFS